MREQIKIPYEDGFADAEQVEVPFPGSFSHEVKLPDGKMLKMDVSIKDFFRLLDKKDEQGEPIYLLNVLIKVATVEAKIEGEVPV